MDTNRAMSTAVNGGAALGAGIEPSGFDEGGEENRNPLLVLHLLLQGRYWMTAVAAIVLLMAGGLVGYRFTPVSYSSTGMIHIKPVIRVFNPTANGGDSGTIPMFDSFVSSQVVLLKSERVVDIALSSELWHDHGRGASAADADEFQKHLIVARDGEIILVKFTDREPLTAQDAVRAVIDAFSSLYLTNEKEATTVELKQLQGLRNEYNDQLLDYNKQIGDITGGVGEDAARQRYQAKVMEATAAEQKWRQSKANLEQMQALKKVLEMAQTRPSLQATEGPAKTTWTAEDIAQIDPKMQGLLSDRDVRVRERDTLLKSFGPNYPRVLAVNQELAVIQADIGRLVADFKPPANKQPGSAGGQLSFNPLLEAQLQLQEGQDHQHYDEAQADVLKLGKQINEINAIMLDVERVRGYLESTKVRIEQINVESAAPARTNIISTGDRPVTRDLRLAIGAASGIGGGLLGIGIFLLWGLLDRRLRTIDQARMSLRQGMRVLGMLPSLPKNLEDPAAASFAALCVHHIRMLMQVMPRMNERPSFAITSPSPGDGKTSLTLALALSYAAAGKSTLLIDCDIVGSGLTRRVNAIIRRRIGQILIRENLITPAELRDALTKAQRSNRRLGEVLVDEGYVDQEQISRALATQAETSVGLLDVMRGEMLEECIADTGIARLWILPVGSALAENAASISPEGIRAVLEQARKRFDVILVDTGPIPGSIESSVACSQVDGVVMAVSRGEQGPLVRRASEHLRDIGARALGIVFNRATPEDFSSSYGSMSSPSIPARIPDKTVGTAFGPVASAVAGRKAKGEGE